MVTALDTRLIRALSLLVVIHAVLAHTHDGAMEMAAAPSVQSQFTNTTISGNMTLHSMPQSYFAYTDHAGLMMAHIVFMTVGWLFVLPIGTPMLLYCGL